jgi:hypothetical protein
MRSASITLADVAKQTDELAIACSKCDRTGRYRPQTLIQRYGPQFAISDLLRTLSVGCPMRESVDPCAMCGIHCLDLSGGLNMQRRGE